MILYDLSKIINCILLSKFVILKLYKYFCLISLFKGWDKLFSKIVAAQFRKKH